jgi:hypothetical protein
MKLNTFKNTPFEHWTPDKADKLLVFVEELCEDPLDASAHLASCLVALCPKLEQALELCNFVHWVADKHEELKEAAEEVNHVN